MLRAVFRGYVLGLGIIIALVQSANAQFTISGTVTDPNALPVFGVDIFLYDNQGTPIGIPPTVTDSFGFYSIAGLPADTYGVGFESPTVTGLLSTIITPVVVAGDVTLDVTLAFGNILSGFVWDTLGVGIPDIDLNVYDQATGVKLDIPGDNTDLNGFYDVVVPSDTFRLRWRPIGGQSLVPVELENVIITSDTTINVTMLAGFFVSGTVQDLSMNPVFDADLDFTDSTTGFKIFTPGDNTDSSGFYEVIVPAGTFNIEVAPQVIDRLVAEEIFGVHIASDTTVDFTLSPGFSLSGTVRDSSGSGVLDVDLDVKYTTTGIKVVTPSDNTDVLGQYEVIVPSGLFNIFYKPPVVSSLAPVLADSVLITADTIIDVTVPAGLLLSGTVQNTGGFGVSGVDIDATDTVTGADVPLSGDHTDSLGAFDVVIVPGIYHVDIEPPKTRRLAAERLLGLSLTQDTSILVTLDTGVSVSGTVTDSSGAPVPDADVSAIVSSSGDTVFTPGDNADTLGYYEIVIPPDTYHLLYRPDSLSGILDSVLLNNVVVANDTVINVSFTDTISDQTPPSVMVFTPNGGEVWVTGSTRNINWNAADNVGVTSVDLYYSNSGVGGPFNTIATGEANDGVYPWTVPNDTTNNAFVKAVAHDGAGNSGEDVSNAAFTISSDVTSPNVTITAPNGGEDWAAGSNQNITWNATDNVGVTSVDLLFSASGAGGPFNTFAAGEANDGVYLWTVPNDPTTNAFVAAVAHDAAGNSDADVSDVAFTISVDDQIAPNVTVTAPNGGEDWAAGSNQNITWNATDNVGVTSVDLYYSTSGAGGPFNTIATGEANDGAYPWTVPNDPATNAFVKAVAHDAAANSGEDVSDAAFIMSGPCCIGNRGNVNGDGGDNTNVADLTYLVDYLFRGGPPPPCQAEGNVDGDAGENVNVADLTYLVDYLFRNGPPPPPCP